jgi:hypothetical protein
LCSSVTVVGVYLVYYVVFIRISFFFSNTQESCVSFH